MELVRRYGQAAKQFNETRQWPNGLAREIEDAVEAHWWNPERWERATAQLPPQQPPNTPGTRVGQMCVRGGIAFFWTGDEWLRGSDLRDAWLAQRRLSEPGS